MKVFHFDIEPPATTHQSALRIMRRRDGTSFVGKMKKSDAKIWETKFGIELKKQKPDKPLAFGKPIKVTVGLFYKPPACRPCRDIEWKVTKPDADNVVKIILDQMVEHGYIEADQKIAHLNIMKLEWDAGGFMEVIIDECHPFSRITIEPPR